MTPPEEPRRPNPRGPAPAPGAARRRPPPKDPAPPASRAPAGGPPARDPELSKIIREIRQKTSPGPRRQRPELHPMTTTLWEYPSQHYDSPGGAPMQGSRHYVGATPSWVIWQLLRRYTQEGDLVVDPMCGSGTTLDVARDLSRRALGYDIAPSRPDIHRADARRLPLEDAAADFVFVDPPYSTHVDYSDDPACIGKLDAGGDDDGHAYFEAMADVIGEMHRILRPGHHAAIYVSDSFVKRRGRPGGRFIPIGFELFGIARQVFEPVDIICVVRHNEKLRRGNFRRAAEEGNFYLRGFNYLLLLRAPERRVRASR